MATKQQVNNAVYEQKDPLLIYKFEAFELFKGFLNNINAEIIGFLCKSGIEVNDPEQVKTERDLPKKQESQNRLSFHHEVFSSNLLRCCPSYGPPWRSRKARWW